MDEVNLDQAIWRKATASGGDGGLCVEVATNLPGVVAVRDSKNPGGPVLTFTSAAWRAFLSGVVGGEFDL